MVGQRRGHAAQQPAGCAGQRWLVPESRVVKIRPRNPRANAHAERWIRTARAEIANQLLIARPRHVRAIWTTMPACRTYLNRPTGIRLRSG